MTAVKTPTAAPDVARLTYEFRTRFLPVVQAFVVDKASGNDLRRAWRPYYDETLQEFDREVEQSWRYATGSDGSVESGPPQADLRRVDPTLEVPLSFFPVSVGHNNLDRLVEVLAVELGDRAASELSVRERLIDLAHVVDALHELLSSLATRP